MLAVAKITQKLWKALNSDVSPVFKNLFNQIKAVYDPQLEPVIEAGCILDWVDSRTGDRPWFS